MSFDPLTFQASGFQTERDFRDATYQRYQPWLRDDDTIARYGAVVFLEPPRNVGLPSQIIVRDVTQFEGAHDLVSWSPTAAQPRTNAFPVGQPTSGLATALMDRWYTAQTRAALASHVGGRA